MSINSVFSAAGVERIEKELGLVLPERCRQTLLTTTFEPEEGDIHDQDFMGDVSQLIEFNRFVRESFVREAEDKKWPDSWLVIGYGEEEATYIDVARQDAPVFVVDLLAEGASAPREVAPTLAAWFVLEEENQEEKRRDFLAFEANLEAEQQERERRRAEARKGRRWWQFWI